MYCEKITTANFLEFRNNITLNSFPKNIIHYLQPSYRKVLALHAPDTYPRPASPCPPFNGRLLVGRAAGRVRVVAGLSVQKRAANDVFRLLVRRCEVVLSQAKAEASPKAYQAVPVQ